MFNNLGNAKFGVRDLDLTVGEDIYYSFKKSRIFPWYLYMC
jgi:hypothetical protein